MSPDELVDIVLPMAPEWDWSGWLVTFVWLVLALLLLLGLLWLLKQWVLPLRIMWRQRQVLKHHAKDSDEVFMFKLYRWLCDAQPLGLTQQEMLAFAHKVELGCFSKHPVSRETLLQDYQSLQPVLRTYLQQDLKTRFAKGIWRAQVWRLRGFDWIKSRMNF